MRYLSLHLRSSIAFASRALLNDEGKGTHLEKYVVRCLFPHIIPACDPSMLTDPLFERQAEGKDFELNADLAEFVGTRIQSPAYRIEVFVISQDESAATVWHASQRDRDR